MSQMVFHMDLKSLQILRVLTSKPCVSLAFPLFIYSNLSLILSVCLTSLVVIGIEKFISLERVAVPYKYLIILHLKFARGTWQEGTPENSCLTLKKNLSYNLLLLGETLSMKDAEDIPEYKY